MKTSSLLLLLSFVIMLPQVTDCQVGNLIKNKVGRAINAGAKTADKEVNKEIDSAAQRGVLNMKAKMQNKAEQNQQNKTEPTGQDRVNQTEGEIGQGNEGQKGINLGSLLGGKVDLKYNEEYKFTCRMIMQMELYDRKDVTKMDYDIYFSKTSPVMAMETKKINTEEGETVPLTSQMVMDGDNKCFLMLTDVNNIKMGIISAVPDENTVQAQKEGKPAEIVKPPEITKTGNTKMIAGYNCDEYLVKEAGSKEYSKMWFTKDAVINVDKRVWSKAGMPAAYGYSAFEGGIIMGWESYDKDGKISAKSEVKEVNNNYSHTVSVKGYSLRQMNFNQGEKK